MRVVRAFRLPIIAAMTALALSGCMRTPAPVAVAQREPISIPWLTASLTIPPSPDISLCCGFRRRRHRRASRQFCRIASAALTPPVPSSMRRADAGGLRHRLSARCRRQAAGRGLRPGRSHQYLRDRCRRLHHHAADRFGAGAGTNARGPRRRHHRQAAQRLYPRAVGRGRDRGLPAVLHPRRSRGPRPISLRAQHDASKARWRLPAASRRAPAATASR